MKIKIEAIESIPERVTITKREFTQLTQKAALYDDYKAAQRQRGQKLQSLLTPEQRSERARRAAARRWNRTEVK